jgi:Tfp pilus assembly protein PilO
MKIVFSKKMLILSIVILAVTAVLDAVFTQLLVGKINSINDKVKQLEISSQERLKELTLKDSIAGSKAEREKLLSYFVGATNADVVDFTKYLEDLAKQAGVRHEKTMNYAPIGELPSSDVVSSLRYRFNVTGAWSNVFAFLQAIENLPKAVLVNNVTLTVSSEAVSVKELRSGNKLWSADLDFSVVKIK